MLRNTEIFISNDSQEELKSIKLAPNGTANMTARIIYSDNSTIILKDGSEVILNEEFVNTLYDNYKITTKRKFLIGKNRYPRVIVEHVDVKGNKVGELRGELHKKNEMINGKEVISIYADILLTEVDIIEDLIRLGKESNFSKVSIGTAFINNDTRKPVLIELSLTDNPAKKAALILSENPEEIEKHQKALEAYTQYIEELSLCEIELSEAKKELNTVKIKLSMSKFLDKQIFLDRISRSDKKMIMSKIKYTEENLDTLKVIYSNLRDKSIISNKPMFNSHYKETQ